MPFHESIAIGRRQAVSVIAKPDSAPHGASAHEIRSAPADLRRVDSLNYAYSGLLIRSLDLFVALVALFLFLPVLLLIMFAIKGSQSGPIIFSQWRVGRHGEMFLCHKFRTMVVDAQDRLERLLAESEEARAEWVRDQKLRHDPRITWVGGFLRRTSLDELPQLINVVMGHMSIVGPRPIVADEIARYGTRFEAYCSVRPGLTGLWQISGRNDVSYAMRVRLDSLYARRQCLSLNVAICLRTVPALLLSRGCY